MLEILTQKLTSVFEKLGRKGKLNEADVDEALRQVRERAIGSEVLRSLTPAQQIIKIVNEELVVILGGEPGRLASVPDPPAVALLVGLQGSGKTTTAVKLRFARGITGLW